MAKKTKIPKNLKPAKAKKRKAKSIVEPELVIIAEPHKPPPTSRPPNMSTGLPEDILRFARDLMTAAPGFSQGQTEAGTLIHARQGDDSPVPLWITGSSEQGKASINSKGEKLSLYGCIAKALNALPVPALRQVMMWWVVAEQATTRIDLAGGDYSNQTHALNGYNELAGLTQDECVEFLDTCANECEAIGAGPFGPPPAITSQTREPIP